MPSRVWFATVLVLLASASWTSAQPAGPVLPKGPHTIVGRLLDIRTGAPLAGAIVSITGYVGAGAQPSRTPPSSTAVATFSARNVMTNADGWFVFRDVPAGRFAIAGAAIGYLSETYPQHWVDVSESDQPTQTTLRLRKSVAVTGIVLDDTGQPAVGIPVSALRSQVVAGRVIVSVAATSPTDDRGEYRIAGLRPGRYLVAAMASTISSPSSLLSRMDAAGGNQTALFQIRVGLIEGGVMPSDFPPGTSRGQDVLHVVGPATPLAADGSPLMYATTFYPGTGRGDAATALILDSGDTRDGLNFQVTYAPTARVVGSVSGPEGPAANVGVRLVPAGTFVAEDLSGGGTQIAISDATGRFAFVGIAPGDYALSASLRTGPEGAFVPWTTTQNVAVPKEGLDGLALTLRPGPSVTGTVVFVGPDDVPRPASMLVGLRPMGAVLWRGGPGRLRPDGTFTAYADAAGAFQVFASTDALPWTWSHTTIGGQPALDGIVTLTDTETRPIVVTMTATAGSVSGRVTNDKTEADPNTSVILFPTDGGMWRQGLINDRRVRLVHTSSNGTFADTAVPPGEYHVAAIPKDLAVDWMTPTFLERLVAGATTVTVRDGDSRTVQLKTLALRGQR